jgi:hypothetical protein
LDLSLFLAKENGQVQRLRFQNSSLLVSLAATRAYSAFDVTSCFGNDAIPSVTATVVNLQLTVNAMLDTCGAVW